MTVLPTANDFIAVFEGLHSLLGLAAFGKIDAVLFHSGPHLDAIQEVFGRNARVFERQAKKHANFSRASRLSKRVHATRLEDVRLGGALDALAIYSFFNETYATDRKTAAREANEVWKYLSRKFASSVSGKVYTCVCGADPERIFLKEELPALMNNDKIASINNVAWKKIRDVYFSDPKTGPQEAYKLICRAEMRLAWDRAKTECTAEAVEDFYYARAYYRIARRREMERDGQTPYPAFCRKPIKAHRAALAALKTRLIPTPAA